MDDQRTVTGGDQQVVCPNRGHEQYVDVASARCEQCGELLVTYARGPQTQWLGDTIPDQSAPGEVAPPEVSGGIGRTTGGTQVPFKVPTAIPGKPMPPIADEPGGVDRQEIQSAEPQSSESHAERGGSG